MDEILGPEPWEDPEEQPDPEQVTFDLKLELAEMIDAENLHDEISSFHSLVQPILGGQHVLAQGPFHSRHTSLFIALLNRISTSPDTTTPCQSIFLTSDPYFAYALGKMANRAASHFDPSVRASSFFRDRSAQHVEIAELRNPPVPRIVIGTPGRMLEYFESGVLDPTKMVVAMADGVDELVDRGFGDQVVGILRCLDCEATQVVMHVGDMGRWREVLGLVGSFFGGGRGVVRVWDKEVLRQAVAHWPWRVSDWVRLGVNV